MLSAVDVDPLLYSTLRDGGRISLGLCCEIELLTLRLCYSNPVSHYIELERPH